MSIVRSLGAIGALAALWLAIGVSPASAAAVVKTIPVGSGPEGVSSDGTHVWVTNFGGGTVSEIDASTGAVVNTITVGNDPEGVSSDGTHVWVTNFGGGTVSEIDASTGAVVNTIPVGSGPAGVSSDGTHVWVANSGADTAGAGDTVSEIDASTGTVVNTITVGTAPYGVSSDGTHVWVTNYGDGTVSEIDALTGAVVNTIAVGANPWGVSSDGTHVWVTNGVGGTVSEIDASTGTVVNTITVGNDPEGVSSDGAHVWVANADGGTVSEIDASTGTVVNTIPVGTAPFAVSSDGTHVWVANYDDDTVSEIQISGGSTLLQGSPTYDTVADGAGYSGQLTVTNATGAVSYTETASADSSDVVVDSSGAITAAKALAPGAYTVSGSDSDTAGDTGSWSFTLTVNGAALTQGAPTYDTVADGVGYSGQLTVTNPTGAVSYTETASADSSDVVVDASGAITAAQTLAPGTYTVGGRDADAAGDSGSWGFTLTVNGATLLQGAPTSATVTKAGGYAGQLTVTNATGTVSYAETASTESSDVVVDSSGAISAANALAPGTYTVSGTDSDAAGDTGTWSFTLTVPSCGKVEESAGDAPAVGTVVNFGQTISTGSGGRVVILFADNTTLTMSANTSIVCDEYVYDPSGNGGSGSDSSTWSLLKGMFMYVSSLIGKNDSDQINVESPVGEIGIRGCVGIAAVRPGGKLLLHVLEGSGFLDRTGKPEVDFPAGEGVLVAGHSYHETLSLPPGAASLIPARYRPPSITAVKAAGRAHQDPVLRFKLSETAQLKLYVRRGKRTAVSVARRAKKGTNRWKVPKALPTGSYTVELVAAHQGLTSIKTAALRIRQHQSGRERRLVSVHERLMRTNFASLATTPAAPWQLIASIR